MAIKIRAGGLSEDLFIETPKGQAKIWISGNEIRIENEGILKEYGLSLSDAIALFFDKAANRNTREKYQTYLSHKGK